MLTQTKKSFLKSWHSMFINHNKNNNMPKSVKIKSKEVKQESGSQYSLRKKCSIDGASSSQVDLTEAVKDKWSTQEVLDMTEGILTHGHFSKDVLKNLPDKSWESYKKFFYQVANFVKKRPPQDELIDNLNTWLGRSKDSRQFAHGPLDTALLLKLLSMDGVVENHPAPEFANGVDFGACYRLLNQAVLGYPIQPLNEPTFKLFFEVFTDVTKSVDNNREVSEKINKFVHNPKPQMDLNSLFFDNDAPKNVIKSYSRKKPTVDKKVPVVKDITGICWDKFPDLKEVLEGAPYNPLKFPHELLLKSMLKLDSEAII